MSKTQQISPTGKIDATVVLPGSKSETIRALFCAALAHGVSKIDNALFCDDTLATAENLRSLGVNISADRQKARFEVTGCAGKLPAQVAAFDFGGGATAMRIMSAVAALKPACYRFDGDASLQARPLLMPALEGVSLEFHEREGYPPFTLKSRGLAKIAGVLDCSNTSQALSALLLAAPCASQGGDISVRGELASAPYVELTLKVMRAFGADVIEEDGRYRIAPTGYCAANCVVEGDATTAGYFLAAAAITGGRVRVRGLSKFSVQADASFAEILVKMGCLAESGDDWIMITGPEKLRGIEANFFSCPDSAPTFAVAAAFAESESLLTGIQNLSLKESDRIDSIAAGLRAIGCEVRPENNALRIIPATLRGARIDSHGDHRIAMSFALAGLKVPGIKITQPECVEKSLPEYFGYLRMLSQ